MNSCLPRNAVRWQSRFQDAGLRMTSPRQAILDFLNKTNKHVSAEDIYINIHGVYPAIGLTTVYRTLELLVKMGLLFKLDFGDGRARYELSHGPEATEHHHHLVCTNCARVIDYTELMDREKELVDRTEKQLSKKYNFRINSHQLKFLGLCKKCTK